MVQIRQEAEIRGTADEVFAAVVDFRGYDRWLTSSTAYKGITEISADPIRQGTTWVEPGRGGDRHGTVTVFEPPTRVTFHQPMTLRPRLLGVIDITVALSLTPGPDSVNVCRVVTIAIPAPLKLVQPLVLRQFRIESGRALLALKSFVEQPDAPTG